MRSIVWAMDEAYYVSYRTQEARPAQLGSRPLRLQPQAFHLLHSCASKKVYYIGGGHPAASLVDKSGRRRDDGCMAGWRPEGWSERQLGARPLMLFKGGWIHESLAIERQNAERDSNNPDRLTIHELDRDVGHAHALPSKTRDGVASGGLEHALECRVRETIESVFPIEQEPTECEAHHRSPGRIRRVDGLPS